MTTKTILIKFLIVLFFITLFTSCLKGPRHSIRFQNNYIQAVSDIKINATSYGRIEVDAITDYKPVEEGNFIVAGTTEGGNPLSGKGYIKGSGENKWTLTLGYDGKLSFSRDILKK